MIRGLYLIVCLACAGCVGSNLSREEKRVLHAILSPRFAASSVPKDREEDFYRTLRVYAKERDPEVFVEGVLFEAPDRIVLLVADEPFRKGYSVIVRRLDGVWTIPKVSLIFLERVSFSKMSSERTPNQSPEPTR